jgi:hypothetical protein
MITMCGVLPEIADPDMAAELVTITAMYLGSGPAGGGALLPGSVLQFTPQPGTLGLTAYPLKLAGAWPPLSELSRAHCAPQNVTADPVALLPSPMTNAPPPGANGTVQFTCTALDVIVPAGFATDA